MIRIREVRVIDDENQQLGVMPTIQALTLAQEKGLDLAHARCAIRELRRVGPR